MKLTLSENICKQRKAHGMTQEQLAEALNVTFASVSKWERGVATPDLGLIAQMANLFGVSLDALVGFEMQKGGVSEAQERVLALQRKKQYDEAFTEAEKALLCYPNHFKIVYGAGELYSLAGIELKKQQYMRRAIELLERSVSLLSQNDEPEMSEVFIRNKIAECYVGLGELEKGLEIWKKYNACGINDSVLAMTYACNAKFNHKDAEKYLVNAFFNMLTTAIRTMNAYCNYYMRQGNIVEARNAVGWLTSVLENTKTDKNAAAYVDKILAPCYSDYANLCFRLGETEKVEPYLRKAFSVAKTFDNCPTFKMENMKFCVGDDVDKAVAYDDLGVSAMQQVVQQITQEDRDKILFETWQKIVDEDENEK